MPDPFEIEKKYRTLQSILPLLSSKKLRILKITGFLKDLLEEENVVFLFAYSAELIQILNNYLSEAEFEGTNPSFLNQIYDIINKIEQKSPADQHIYLKRVRESLENKILEIENIIKTKSPPSHSVEKVLTGTAIIPLVEKENLLQKIESPFACLLRLRLSIRKTKTGDSVNFRNHKMAIQNNEKSVSLRLIKKIISDSFSIKIRDGCQVDCWFDGNISLTGDSLNAGLSALLICELLNQNQYKKKYFLSSLAAITGSVDDAGVVIPVDEEGLKIKTEACFFSRIKYFVVPKTQASIAEAKVDELKKEYPNGLLNIIPCSEIKDLLFDRRIIFVQKINPVKRSYNYVKRNKVFFISIIAIILLILLLKIEYGPFDKNPVAAAFKGKYLYLKNKYNEEITKFRVGQKTVDISISGKNISFFDIDNDGINEVFWEELDPANNCGTIYCTSLNKKKPVWSFRLKKKLNFLNNPVEDENFRSPCINVGDYDLDGKPEVYVLANGDLYPGLLLKLDAKTGKELGSYVNTGQFASMDIIDLNNDGKKEILLVGINNALRSACVVVLDPKHIDGHSPTTKKYKLEGYDKGKEMYYVLIPPTIVGQAYKDKSKWNSAYIEFINRKEKTLKISVTDVNLNLSYIPTFYIYFNFQLQPLYFTTSDYYDMLAETLYKNHQITRLPDQEYFKEYLKTLKYRDGEKWVYKPVVNGEYAGLKTAELK